MSHFRRSPRLLMATLADLRAELAPETVLAQAQAAWRAAVGDAIAEQAQPMSEWGGVLTISCSASVWAQELDLMSSSIIERLNRELGTSEITRIKCVTTPF